MRYPSGAQWLSAVTEVVRYETTPVWVPLMQAQDLGERLVKCTFVISSARRGGWQGRDVVFNESLEGATAQCCARGGAPPDWRGTVRLVEEPDSNNLVTFSVRVQEGRNPSPKDQVQVFPEPFLARARDWLVATPEVAVSRDVTVELTRRITAATARGLRAQHPAPQLSYPLRKMQQRALALADSPIGVCWGPPGTGKTTTLAALVATLVAAGQRVLVVAPTNVAADGACLAIDRALTEIRRVRRRGDVLRVQAPQLATQFKSQNPDLLVWEDERSRFTDTLIKARSTNEQARADLLLSSGVQADEARRLAATSSETEEALRKQWADRQLALIEAAQVVVSTVRTAINRNLPHDFTHVFLDEASMVPISDGLLLAWQQRGRGDASLLLFGDHKQLGPIVPRLRQDSDDAADEDRGAAAGALVEEWFGQDVLSWVMDHGGDAVTVMLDEQSRMNPQLCQVVSTASYGGNLRAVGAPAGGLMPDLPSGICVLQPDEMPGWLKATWNATGAVWNKYNYSPSQPQVARATVALARYLTARGYSVLVCTPFRGQASLIRRGLADLPAVRSGTIHRMQGQEADVCIFDPCQPGRRFLNQAPTANQLVNVAASRAKSVLVLSNSVFFIDQNPLLAPYLKVATVLR